MTDIEMINAEISRRELCIDAPHVHLEIDGHKLVVAAFKIEVDDTPRNPVFKRCDKCNSIVPRAMDHCPVCEEKNDLT